MQENNVRAEPLCLKPSEVADALSCSRSYVYKLIQDGRLRRVTLGDHTAIRIPIEDVRALAEGHAPVGS